MKKHKPFTIYPPDRLRLKIAARAQEKERPMNFIIVKALERHFERLERKPAPEMR